MESISINAKSGLEVILVRKSKNTVSINKQPGRRALIGWTMGFVVFMYSVFIIFPTIYGFVASFFNWNPFQNIFDFVGFQNYTYVLKSPDFWEALWNTVYFTFGSLLLTVVIGLLLAAMIHAVSRGKGFYRGAYFLPVISSMVAACMLWKFLYGYDDGLFNSILMSLGLGKVPWLQNPNIALPAIMVVQAWKDIGYALVLLLAGIN
ncbi:MAG: sugar ABC transporter permease, partial [Oscillospiraceae bacterium]